MITDDKKELLRLGKELSTVGVEFRIAQIGLEKAVEEHGMSSNQAVEAAQLCSEFTLRFSELEEKYLALRAQILTGE